ncbi:MAG: gamma-glutamyl-gamma-aminobutyrate hydrolase family protein [Sulfobacillus thermotolerans]|uniref:Peptidase C26 n=1 Tax=Sulfobacillus thermotolerans TaxID=338644 RepID=A0ABN5H2B9_9FIRM|nr:peptidase C26 [Sulfobacillus thermotolerans]MCY0907619.1 gamma-glutamyl-gamma-aminobutyrate hydrolase family protein [Sulfobacillus thermotolerans]
MESKPLIAISMSRELGPDNVYRDFLRAPYLHAVVQAGGIPVLLPNVPESQEALLRCDGLLLTGGGDFDPAAYGALDAGTNQASISKDRDRTEIALVRAALQHKMPVFGICRGVQAIAVAQEGTLVQDIPRVYPTSDIHHNQSQPRQQATHGVTVLPGTKLHHVTETTDLRVNSFHHQALDKVPRGWNVAAHAEDGLVEAIEYPGNSWGIGVQWHPEDLVDSETHARKLFADFVDAARQYMEQERHNV